MAKPCVWCGAGLADDVRICPSCRSAQPYATPGAPAPPPPPAPYPQSAYAYGPQPRRSDTGRTVAIVIGALVGSVALLALVCILAITFLGRSASSKFEAIDPSGTPVSGASSGTGRDYPIEVRSNFLASCAANGSAAACSCALERIEEQYTFEEFLDVEQDFRRTGTFPPAMLSAVASCARGG